MSKARKVTFPCMLWDLPEARVHLTCEAKGMRFYCGGFDSFHAAEAETAKLVSRFIGRGASVAFYMVDRSGGVFISAHMDELDKMLPAKESGK